MSQGGGFNCANQEHRSSNARLKKFNSGRTVPINLDLMQMGVKNPILDESYYL